MCKVRIEPRVTELFLICQPQWTASQQDFMMSRSLGGGPRAVHQVSKDM